MFFEAKVAHLCLEPFLLLPIVNDDEPDVLVFMRECIHRIDGSIEAFCRVKFCDGPYPEIVMVVDEPCGRIDDLHFEDTPRIVLGNNRRALPANVYDGHLLLCSYPVHLCFGHV